jgi:hypothetical protein
MVRCGVVVTFRDWTIEPNASIVALLANPPSLQTAKGTSHMAILRNLNELTREQLIEALAAAQAQPARKLSMKVSDKGAISVYGLGRFPVTLYAGQWDRLLSLSDDLRAFAKANVALLATKD